MEPAKMGPDVSDSIPRDQMHNLMMTRPSGCSG